MLTTTHQPEAPTWLQDATQPAPRCDDLIRRYEAIVGDQRLNWTTHLRLMRRLGAGGQGVVFLSQLRGADGFTLPVALKIFSPERYTAAEHYDEDMERIGRIAARVAGIQHENVLVVQNFLDRNRIRMLVMEWIEGFDLRRLLDPRMLTMFHSRVPADRWNYINNVLITAGPEQSRFKAGVAVAIVRDCLAALSALHRHGVVHSDVKPANIMLKCSGYAKLVDIGAAFESSSPPLRRACTPAYAALEVMQGATPTPQSDLASLGYVLIELLSGRQIFTRQRDLQSLIELKQSLGEQLYDLLPPEVTCNTLLMSFCNGLVSPEPGRRFLSAEAAELVEEGAAAFHRQLVKADIASEYDTDIRVWIEELLALEASIRAAAN